MKIQWDEKKRQYVFERRGIDFSQLNELLYFPYIEDQRSEEPEQYRIIGFAEGKLTTFIIEYRQGGTEEYIWIVTAWYSTTEERRDYERETRI